MLVNFPFMPINIDRALHCHGDGLAERAPFEGKDVRLSHMPTVLLDPRSGEIPCRYPQEHNSEAREAGLEELAHQALSGSVQNKVVEQARTTRVTPAK